MYVPHERVRLDVSMNTKNGACNQEVCTSAGDGVLVSGLCTSSRQCIIINERQESDDNVIVLEACLAREPNAL